MDKLKYVQDVVNATITGIYVKAVKYVAPNYVIRATRTRYGGRINNRSNISITLTIGKPNFAEREFIKLCQKAKEPFPVKKIQMKLYTPKPKKVKRNKK